MKNVLTIAGSDCSGGAGIQADIKTFQAHGAFGMSVITAVVAENTCDVISIHDIPVINISDQIDAIFLDISVAGVKVGMLSGEEIMNMVAQKLAQYQPKNVVIDPVMVAKGGCSLMDPAALNVLQKKMIPLAFCLTPNIPEAEVITGKKIRTIEDMKMAAKAIYQMGAKNVLVKGGHFLGEPTDILYDGTEFHSYKGKRIHTKNTHGTGCTLSSAITANLANGKTIYEAVRSAKEYVAGAIQNALEIGKGHGPTNHFYKYYELEEKYKNENL
ncbi:bifunctional hydroxymethylpyrimidine kinase/phosphomethylpyrimidine kinase [Anaeromicropila populeti]|uniref:Hydroxymethylpyrimidine/phosphomethylpyrimidine kinase n=1 Tax=Anaeromicropila populeti TaxID=37658 RepID=A0A1I6JN83_9FIRM|nr:bifunctional hydroxymethylpyrimidine kinase/phosphomethylpyrimidine kinase [Anaeromicropila populeti]SFR80435.1 hydroxymethylpyrimidine/phosphomethylpyrimidine kinase [Anaeromicropila populeti]